MHATDPRGARGAKASGSNDYVKRNATARKSLRCSLPLLVISIVGALRKLSQTALLELLLALVMHRRTGHSGDDLI
jgi:hypothetical protein